MTQIICKMPSRLMAAFSHESMGIRCEVTADAVDIWLHGIVGDEYTQTDSLSVSKILAENKGKPVNLRVNSPGGLAYDGVAMFNAIDSHNGPTTGIIEGMAGSAASLAVMACDVVRCHATAVFHPHYSLIMAMGHQADLREALAIQERLDLDLEAVYSEASGRSIEQVKDDLMGAHGDGTRFSAEQAMAAGYVDEVIQHNKKKPTASVPDHSAALAMHNKRLAIISRITS